MIRRRVRSFWLTGSVLGGSLAVALWSHGCNTAEESSASIDAASGEAQIVDAQGDTDPPEWTLGCEPNPRSSDFQPGWVPPRERNDVCLHPLVVSGYLTCRLTPPEENVDAAICDQFVSMTSAECADCLITPGDAATRGASFESHGGAGATLNTAGCVALLEGDRSSTSCAARFAAIEQCATAACARCFVEGGASFHACTTRARQTVCKDLDAGDTCNDLVQLAGSAHPCLPSSSFIESAVRLGVFFCQSGADAGTDAADQ